jgi:hypothetical protein
VADETNPTERGVAIGLLCEKADAKVAIPELVSVYKNAKGEGLKMDAIQTLEILATKYGGASIDQVKELARASLSQQNTTKLQSVLSKVLENLERKEQKKQRE